MEIDGEKHVAAILASSGTAGPAKGIRLALPFLSMV